MVNTPHFDLDIDSTLGGNNASDYVIPSQKAIKDYVDNNTGSTVDQTYDPTSQAPQSGVAIAGAGFLTSASLTNYVTTNTEQTITAKKTFNTRVNFLGTGDANAIYLSTDTRIDVHGTSNTVLGFASGTFLINNAAYNLMLRGKQTRPVYNSNSNPIALLSDIPTESTVSSWGFTKNTGTVTSVNNVSPVNGNVTLSIPSEVTETTVSGWGFTKNVGTVTSVNNVSPVDGNVTLEVANKDLSNLSSTGNAKFQAPITGGASSITSSNLTTSRALVSDARGKVAVSSVTSTQLGYLSTVTSNVQTQLNGKQATLESGTNIKTINSTSLLGSGNISVGTVTSVNNIQPINGNITLSIPAAQINSDWNATSGVAQILNKPTIPDTSNLANKDLSNLSTAGQAIIDGKADTTLSNLDSTGQAVIDGKVSKTGDTMTGTLTLSSTVNQQLKILNPDISRGTTPSSPLYEYIRFVDNNDNNLGGLYFKQHTDGSVSTRISCVNADGSDFVYAALGYDASGESYFRFPNSPCVDGQWVLVTENMLTNGTISPDTNYTYTLSFLPNDGSIYEIIGYIAGRTLTTSGNYFAFYGYSSLMSNGLLRAITRTSAYNAAMGSFNFIIGSDRKFWFKDTGSGATGVTLGFRAYRRIGTNA